MEANRRWTVAIELCTCLEHLGVSQRSFATMCGMNHSTVRSHLSGDRVPSEETLRRYLEVIRNVACARMARSIAVREVAKDFLGEMGL